MTWYQQDARQYIQYLVQSFGPDYCDKLQTFFSHHLYTLHHTVRGKRAGQYIINRPGCIHEFEWEAFVEHIIIKHFDYTYHRRANEYSFEIAYNLCAYKCSYGTRL